MKELSLFIRPDKLETVKTILLDEYGLGGMTVLNALGCGNQKGYAEEYRGTRTGVHLLPKLKVEVIVDDDKVEDVIREICKRTAEGLYGDGKIVIKNVEDVIRVRTMERGSSAI